MNSFDTVEIWAPAAWAGYLINGDATSIDDEERAAADAMLNEIDAGGPVDCGEPEFRDRPPLRGYGSLGGDYCLYTLIVPIQE